MIVFTNRRGAGQQLAKHLSGYRGVPHLLVLSLTRSAVPVAFEVARMLDAPLRLFGESTAMRFAGRTVIVVADGLPGAARMLAALIRLRRRSADRLIAAVPVAAEGVVSELAEVADRVICLSTPHQFRETQLWYADFPRVTEREVRELLGLAPAGDEFASLEQITEDEERADAVFVDDEELIPGADLIDDLGIALGITYKDDEPLRIGVKEHERDEHRWELDPASSDDYAARSHDLSSAERLLTMKHKHSEKRH